MNTNHFNKLTEAEQERLSILAEECGEVIQIIGKILRHGYESYNPNDSNKTTNRSLLEKEIAHTAVITNIMARASDINEDSLDDYYEDKETNIKKYLHHQG